jgi:hypothetical protein
MATGRGPKPAFQVGDWVRFQYGVQQVPGVIIEDRGLLGFGGCRLYHVNVPIDPDEPMLCLVDEDQMEPGEPPGAPDPVRDKDRIVAYLKRAGLVSILRAETPGPKFRPRAWLCYNTLGNVTYTFDPERGGLGGVMVPFQALDGYRRLFPDKKEEVLALLAGFGLTREEAEELIQKARLVPRPLAQRGRGRGNRSGTP